MLPNEKRAGPAIVTKPSDPLQTMHVKRGTIKPAVPGETLDARAFIATTLNPRSFKPVETGSVLSNEKRAGPTFAVIEPSDLLQTMHGKRETVNQAVPGETLDARAFIATTLNPRSFKPIETGSVLPNEKRAGPTFVTEPSDPLSTMHIKRGTIKPAVPGETLDARAFIATTLNPRSFKPVETGSMLPNEKRAGLTIVTEPSDPLQTTHGKRETIKPAVPGETLDARAFIATTLNPRSLKPVETGSVLPNEKRAGPTIVTEPSDPLPTMHVKRGTIKLVVPGETLDARAFIATTLNPRSFKPVETGSVLPNEKRAGPTFVTEPSDPLQAKRGTIKLAVPGETLDARAFIATTLNPRSFKSIETESMLPNEKRAGPTIATEPSDAIPTPHGARGTLFV